MKIGQFNWQQKQRRPEIPDRFQRLSNAFFSLGQDIDYYKALMQVPENERVMIFAALRDVANDEALYIQALEKDVMTESLMRSTGPRKVEVQYRAVLNDGVELTPFEFSYRAAKTRKSLTVPIELEFNVTPSASPPTNIHVLIGRNGVGKTHLLNGMTRALVDPETSKRRDGAFSFKDSDIDFLGEAEETFANLVSVTFSAFDDFLSIKEAPRAQKAIISYTNVSLRKQIGRDDKRVITQNIEQLSTDFAKSARVCARACAASAGSALWKRSRQTASSPKSK